MGKEVKQTNSWVWKKVLGMTILGWINILILQWLFIRLSYHWVYLDPEKDEEAKARVYLFWDNEKSQFVAKTFYYYAIIGCILPLTGWWGDYVMPFKFKCRLTKVREYFE